MRMIYCVILDKIPGQLGRHPLHLAIKRDGAVDHVVENFCHFIIEFEIVGGTVRIKNLIGANGRIKPDGLQIFELGHVICRERWMIFHIAAPLGFAKLLHRDGFSKITRLVDVGALGDGDVIGEQLDGNRIENRRDEGVNIAQRDGPAGLRF